MSITTSDKIKFTLDIEVEHDLEVDPDSVLSIVSYVYLDNSAEPDEPFEIRHSFEEIIQEIIEHYSEDSSRNGFGQLYTVGHELRRISESVVQAAELLEESIYGKQISMIADLEEDILD